MLVPSVYAQRLFVDGFPVRRPYVVSSTSRARPIASSRSGAYAPSTPAMYTAPPIISILPNVKALGAEWGWSRGVTTPYSVGHALPCAKLSTQYSARRRVDGSIRGLDDDSGDAAVEAGSDSVGGAGAYP